MVPSKIMEERSSANCFMDLHRLRSAAYLRYLFGSPAGSAAWWKENNVCLLVLIETVDSESLLSPSDVDGETTLDSLQPIFTQWNRATEEVGGIVAVRDDILGKSEQDFVWCARFEDQTHSAVRVAEEVRRSFEADLLGSPLQITVSIGKHEYAARSVLERARPDGIYLGLECHRRLTEGESVSQLPSHVKLPEDESYERRQRRLIKSQTNDAFQDVARNFKRSSLV